jgi:hypothetical protein
LHPGALVFWTSILKKRLKRKRCKQANFSSKSMFFTNGWILKDLVAAYLKRQAVKGNASRFRKAERGKFVHA